MSNKWEMLGQLQEQSTRLRKVEKQLDKLQSECSLHTVKVFEFLRSVKQPDFLVLVSTVF